MLDELRARFRTRFIDTARDRLQRCLGLLGESDRAKELAVELHSLAGEAAMLGLYDVAETARRGEEAARRWSDGAADAQVACARAVRTARQQVEDFAAEPPGPGFDQDELSHDPDAQDPDASRTQQGRRVLVVDDSALAREDLADSLSRAGLDTRTATDQDAAVRELAAFAPALVLTDVQMPGTTPAELCAALRAASRSPLVIVLMSGQADEALARAADGARADGFVSKQHGTEHIVARVCRALEEAAS